MSNSISVFPTRDLRRSIAPSRPGRAAAPWAGRPTSPASTRRSSSWPSCACRRSTTAPSACRSISTCRAARRAAGEARPGRDLARGRHLLGQGMRRTRLGGDADAARRATACRTRPMRRVRRHFSEDEVIALSVAVANINAWNRLRCRLPLRAADPEEGDGEQGRLIFLKADPWSVEATTASAYIGRREATSSRSTGTCPDGPARTGEPIWLGCI